MPSSLVSRVVFLVAALVGLTGIAIGWLGYHAALDAAREEARQWLTNAAALCESVLERDLGGAERTVDAVAANDAVRALLEAHAAGRDVSALLSRARAPLLEGLRTTPMVLALLVADSSGFVIAASDDSYLGRGFADHPDFKKGLAEHHISDPVFTGSKHEALAWAPVPGGRGASIAVLDWSGLMHALTDVHFGVTGRVSIIALRGRDLEVLYGTRNVSPGTRLSLADAPITGRGAMGERGFAEAVSREGEGIVGAYLPVRRTRWGLGVKISAAEAYQEALRLRWVLPMSTMGLVLVGVLSALLFSRRIAGLEQRLEERSAALEQALVEQQAAEFSLRQSQEQLRLVSKMEAVGTLAAGVAHHFSNMLQVMLGHAEGLDENAPDPAQRRAVDTILRTGERAAQLVRRLLRFARRDSVENPVIDVNAVAAETGELVRSFMPEFIGVETALAPSPAPVKMDPRELEELLVNLAINARDAMPTGGRLTIGVEAPRRGPADEAGVVTLRVTDTGCGMDEATRARLFEPFFTTKGPDRGTGLGLAIVFGIVQRQGGQVEVESAPGAGTTFTITLPAAPHGSAVATMLEEPRDPAAPLPGRGEILLVVENLSELRDIIVQRLTDSGYTVLETGTGAEAEALARDWTEPIDLLLVDVALPDGSGLELAARLRGPRPRLAVLAMSGQRSDVMPRGGPVCLVKPFRIGELLREVRRALDSRPA